MKKAILSTFCIAMFLESFAFEPMNTEVSGIEITAAAENDCKEITVYTLTKVGQYGTSSKAYKGLYNAKTNELTVGRMTFSVHENMAYGQENDYRSAYRYQAGDYYFNL